MTFIGRTKRDKLIPAPIPPNWRCDSTLACRNVYKRKFAILPVDCVGGDRVWFEYYYAKYQIWHYSSDTTTDLHTDRHEDITEAEYIVRRLTEGF